MLENTYFKIVCFKSFKSIWKSGGLFCVFLLDILPKSMWTVGMRDIVFPTQNQCNLKSTTSGLKDENFHLKQRNSSWY